MSSYDLFVQKLTEDHGVEPERISRDASLSDLGLDSLSIVELVFDIEDELGIQLKEEEADFTTLGGAVDLVDRKVAEKEAGTS